MAKIWYSVFGEGMGHAMRSAPIIEHLLKKHDLIITAGDKAYPYLKKRFGARVHKIKSLHFIIENNEIDLIRTANNFINTYSLDTQHNVLITYNLIKKFKPHIIISDFEPVSHYFASILKIPIINLDNIHVLTKCKIDFDKKFLPLYYASQFLINTIELQSDFYLICALKDFLVKEKNVFLFPPIIREEVLDVKIKKSESILVYQTSSTNSKLVEDLKKLKAYKFIFYGMNVSKKEENIIFKNFHSKTFVEDLSSCKAAILNGGFTGLSEAIYLKKPVLIVPVKNQFEQIFNGETIKKMKIGDWHEDLDYKKINKFIDKVPFYNKNLQKIPKWENSRFFEKLEELIEQIGKNDNYLLSFVSKVELKIFPKKYQRTLTILKPDAIEGGKIGEVIKRLEAQKIKPIAMKMVQINEADARNFYINLQKKLPQKVFESIIKYMSSGKIVVIVWQGNGVVNKVRKICGPTDPKKARRYQIRNLSKDSLEEELKKGRAVKNIIHSSASTKEAKNEIKFFFRSGELGHE